MGAIEEFVYNNEGIVVIQIIMKQRFTSWNKKTIIIKKSN